MLVSSDIETGSGHNHQVSLHGKQIAAKDSRN